MLELEEALARILASLPKPPSERVPLPQAYGRVAAESVIAPMSLPPFDNSSMDGFAVRAPDIAAATPEMPVRLRLVGRVAAGGNFKGELNSGECLRLFTGSPVPRGADAVVMQEYTKCVSESSGEVLILDAAKPWENIRFRGEDVKYGAPLVGPGETLGVGHIALLAAVGLAEVTAGRRPRVALLATGSELKESGDALAPGQIYESNRKALTPLIEHAGGIVTAFPIVPDESAKTRAALEQAFAECDIVITCGGVSVGELDFVKSAFEDLGGQLNFWKVAIKPGRPFVFGQLGSKFLFGLPGNPISAFVTFLLLARPALLRWQGASAVALPSYPGILAEPISNPGERRHFMRVRVDSSGFIRVAGIQASHVLSSFAAANGLLDVPPKRNFPSGATLPVLRWD